MLRRIAPLHADKTPKKKPRELLRGVFSFVVPTSEHPKRERPGRQDGDLLARSGG